MPICKCRKRTELHCWHCSKGVCFDCIVDEEHKLAHVGTFLEYLTHQESSPPVCQLSGKLLTAEDEVVRFMNLQIFLLSAIDEYGRSKPPHTALAGFTIPGTEEPMVPPANNQTKLAKEIRAKLSRFPWIAPLIALPAESKETETTSVEKSDVSLVSSAMRKVPQPTSPKKQDEHLVMDLERDISASSSHLEDTDEATGKYKRRPIGRAFEALGLLSPKSGRQPSAPTRGYNFTGKRLGFILALLITLFIVFFLGFNIDSTLDPKPNGVLSEVDRKETKQTEETATTVTETTTTTGIGGGKPEEGVQEKRVEGVGEVKPMEIEGEAEEEEGDEEDVEDEDDDQEEEVKKRVEVVTDTKPQKPVQGG